MARPMTAGRAAATALTALLACALIVLPLGRLVGVVADGGIRTLEAALTAPGMGTAVWHSLTVAAGATALALPGGTLLALMDRAPGVPGGWWTRGAVLAPLLVPQFVLGYSWTTAYGRAGLLDTLVGTAVPGLVGPGGVVVVTAVTLLPLAYLIVAAGLATRAEPDLVRAARTCGAGAATALRTVTLPLLRTPLAAAGVVVFLAGLEAFAVPAVLGAPAGFSTVTTRIYRDLALASRPDAFTDAITLSVLLVAVAVVVLVPADLLLGVDPRQVNAGTGSAPPPRRPTAGGRLAAMLLWCYLLLAVVIPLAALVSAALTPAVGVSPVPAHWTLANLRSAVSGPALPALARSLSLAVTAAFLLTAMGGLVATLGRSRSGRALAAAVTLMFALPGSALAVGVLLVYGRWLGGTLLIVLLAYLAKLWPLGHRPVAGAVARLPAAELHAARISGAGRWRTVGTVVLPALAPALAGGWLLVFVVCLHELTMSSLLYGPSSETLAVVVLNQQQLGEVGPTAALAVLLTALLAVPAVPASLWWLLRRRHGRAPGRPDDG